MSENSKFCSVHQTIAVSFPISHAWRFCSEALLISPRPWKFQQGQCMRRMFAVEVGQPEETATRKRVSSAAMCITASPPT